MKNNAQLLLKLPLELKEQIKQTASRYQTDNGGKLSSSEFIRLACKQAIRMGLVTHDH